MKFEIVIDGTDGAGKSHFIQEFKVFLEDLGFSAIIFSPYKIREVYPLWEKYPDIAAKIITNQMKLFRERHQMTDIILWDRGWPTAYVSTDDERARAKFQPFPPLTILLLNTIEKTLKKVREENLTGIWVNDIKLIQLYNQKYRELEGVPFTYLLKMYPDDSGMFDFKQMCKDIKITMEKIGMLQ